MKSYVKVFNGHEVPEGSTHQASDTSFVLFAKWIGNHPVFFDVRNDSWVEDKLIGRHYFKELPEAKWEPVVGEHYQVNHGLTFAECFYIGKDFDGCFAYQVTKGDYKNELDSTNLSSDFKPLKSDKDLARDEFVAHAKVINKSLGIGVDISGFLSALFDAGFTAPKELK
jgi:hypothetical protein